MFCKQNFIPRGLEIILTGVFRDIYLGLSGNFSKFCVICTMFIKSPFTSKTIKEYPDMEVYWQINKEFSNRRCNSGIICNRSLFLKKLKI